jgi:hypothetical protein
LKKKKRNYYKYWWYLEFDKDLDATRNIIVARSLSGRCIESKTLPGWLKWAHVKFGLKGSDSTNARVLWFASEKKLEQIKLLSIIEMEMV